MSKKYMSGGLGGMDMGGGTRSGGSTSGGRGGYGTRGYRKTNKLQEGADVSVKYNTKNVKSPKDAVKAVKESKLKISKALDKQYKIVKNPKFASGFGPKKVKSRTSSVSKAPVKPSSGRMNKKGKK